MSRKFDPRPGFVVQAYQFALDPTEGQRAALASHCGGQRVAFNWGLARVKANLAQRQAERSYGLGEDDLTPCVNWSAYSLRKAWNQAKHEVAPWWAENSKEVYSCGLANLATALGNWNNARTGERRGRGMEFPRFKSKRTSLWSYTVTTGAFGLGDDRRHVQLPRIGAVRTHESTRKLARRIEADTARIMKATVSYRRGRWFVSLQAEVLRDDPQPASRGGVVGVDLGVKHLAVLSTGEQGPNPKHLEAAQRELRRLQRQAARRWAPGRKPDEQSQRWHHTQDRIRRLHTYIANAGQDGLHQLSTRLTREFDTIVIEDLNVAGLTRNRRLARHIADARHGRTTPADHLQNHLERARAGHRRPVVPVQQNLFGLRRGESQTAPVRTHLHLRCLRHEPRSRPQRRPQPRRLGGRGCGRHVLPELRGDEKRARRKPT